MRRKWRSALLSIVTILTLSSFASAASLTGITLQPVNELGDPEDPSIAAGTWSTDSAAPSLGVVLNGTGEMLPFAPFSIQLDPGLYILKVFGDGTYPENAYYGCTLTFSDTNPESVVAPAKVFNANGTMEIAPLPEGSTTLVETPDGTTIEILGFGVSSLETPIITNKMAPESEVADTTAALIIRVTKEQVWQKETITLSNGFEITFEGVQYNEDGTSEWTYSVSELPEARDLSNWVLELPDLSAVTEASPEPNEIVHPDPNAQLNGIKWETGGGFEQGTFTVVLNGHFAVGTVRVAAKGPDVAFGEISGPSGDQVGQPVNPGKKRNPIRANFVPRRGEDRHTIAFIARTRGEVTSWQWDFGDGQTSTDQNPTHAYSEPGRYKVTLTAAGPLGSSTRSRMIRVRK